MATRVRTACKKCRSLKHKCDFRFPRCSRCQRLGIECLVQDPLTKEYKSRDQFAQNDYYETPKEVDKTDLSRRVQFLEEKVAKYESMFERMNNLLENSSNSISIDQLTVLSMIPFKGSLSSADNEITKSSIFGKIDSNQHLEEIEKPPESKRACDQIIFSYYQFAWIQHPIIENQDTLYLLSSRYYNSGNELSDWELFLLYISLAIGTAITGDSSSKVQKYYLSSVVFLKRFLCNIPTLQTPHKGNQLQLQSLQSLLLICSFGLLKPISPGIWYVVANAMRLCVDLDFQDENMIEKCASNYERRLFWCCYTLDRQICCYVNKPFSLNDVDITTKMIIPDKTDVRLTVSYLFFKIRNLQSLIQQYAHTKTPVSVGSTVDDWRADMHVELNNWLLSVIECENTPNTDLHQIFYFSKKFLILTYFQQMLTLYRPVGQNLRTLTYQEYDLLLNCGTKVISIYNELDLSGNINYKYLSVYSIYQSGLTIFYCIINSQELASHSQMSDRVEHIMQTTSSLLQSLKVHCPPAENAIHTLEKLYHTTRDLIQKRKQNPVMHASVSSKIQYGPFDNDQFQKLAQHEAVPLVELADTSGPGYDQIENDDLLRELDFESMFSPLPQNHVLIHKHDNLSGTDTAHLNTRDLWEFLFEEPFNLKNIMFD
ncbi:hypothetical protein OGAPHI_000563 [Ogataea philodendri]|uniref:Zn(2)-C6 fungal-type domain-containing protein n=1 Tax=Ogataea philodendri TaxID=1378263 RepID=A0A9P8PGS4_9ASCO|nr:uncharacterized protein OGAPHI_000563 [Ogataea philodendri]KAH3671340.1 hypothetical protein OGAPHI_000563 [Ogataea philodendri]